MSVSVLMPALSPTMTEGTLASWLVKEGDSVKAGDVIAEIETDKATMEVEALDDGVVAKLAVAEGTQNVAVNALIAVLAEDGESVADALAAVAAAPAGIPSTTTQTDAPAAAAPAAAGDAHERRDQPGDPPPAKKRPGRKPPEGPSRESLLRAARKKMHAVKLALAAVIGLVGGIPEFTALIVVLMRHSLVAKGIWSKNKLIGKDVFARLCAVSYTHLTLPTTPYV